tara:strand:+ start:376 stop:618 length:243 start_codon:yes stop_codon:yes gene_type:complete
MSWTYARMQEYQLVSGDTAQNEFIGQISTQRMRTNIEQLLYAGMLEQAPELSKTMAFNLYPPELLVESPSSNSQTYNSEE